jgi:tRNA dimethylallyltransferase
MGQREKNKLVILLAGPTGVGKTELSFQIGQQLSVEIISADSRQVFKWLDIGTAKPAKSLLKVIPHHFIDFLKPDVYYSAGQFGISARTKIEEIFQRGNLPLIVGGSGLYIRAVLDGFFDGDSIDTENRKILQRRLKTEGSEALYEELIIIDSPVAQTIHPRNGKRITRALEVYHNTGKRLSELQRKRPASYPSFTALKFGLMRERSQLYQRINERVDQMLREGFVTEVQKILERGYDKNLNSLNTVGYKEVIDYLEGDISLDTCVELIKRNTRRYAKRQLTWFRAEKDIRWLTLDESEPLSEIAKKIIKIYRREIKRLDVNKAV